MKKIVFLFLIIVSCSEKPNQNKDINSNIDFITAFEKSESLETATYNETIQYYTDLADVYSEISIQEIGETDSGKPLHIVTLNMNGSNNDFESLRKNNRILLINKMAFILVNLMVSMPR